MLRKYWSDNQRFSWLADSPAVALFPTLIASAGYIIFTQSIASGTRFLYNYEHPSLRQIKASETIKSNEYNVIPLKSYFTRTVR